MQSYHQAQNCVGAQTWLQFGAASGRDQSWGTLHSKYPIYTSVLYFGFSRILSMVLSCIHCFRAFLSHPLKLIRNKFLSATRGSVLCCWLCFSEATPSCRYCVRFPQIPACSLAATALSSTHPTHLQPLPHTEQTCAGGHRKRTWTTPTKSLRI